MVGQLLVGRLFRAGPHLRPTVVVEWPCVGDRTEAPEAVDEGRQVRRVLEVFWVDPRGARGIRRLEHEAALAVGTKLRDGEAKPVALLGVVEPVPHYVGRGKVVLEVRGGKPRLGADEAPRLYHIGGQRAPAQHEVFREIPQRVRVVVGDRPDALIDERADKMVLKIAALARREERLAERIAGGRRADVEGAARAPPPPRASARVFRLGLR